MRTVASLGIEPKVDASYTAKLGATQRVSVRNAVAFGISLALALSGYLFMMMAGVLYGGCAQHISQGQLISCSLKGCCRYTSLCRFELSGEMRSSTFNMVHNGVTFCARDGNRLTTVTTDSAVCPSGLQLFEVSCLTADGIARSNVEYFGFVNASSFRQFTQVASARKASLPRCLVILQPHDPLTKLSTHSPGFLPCCAARLHLLRATSPSSLATTGVKSIRREGRRER